MKYQDLIEHFKSFLRKEKHRITPERLIVLDYALKHKGHFSADDLYLKMNSEVSRATVYNTLDLLAKCKLITVRNLGDNMKRYESNASKDHHDHLICTECGKIIEFHSPDLERIQQEICKHNNFEPSKYSFNIYGRCKDRKNCEQNR